MAKKKQTEKQAAAPRVKRKTLSEMLQGSRIINQLYVQAQSDNYTYHDLKKPEELQEYYALIKEGIRKNNETKRISFSDDTVSVNSSVS